MTTHELKAWPEYFLAMWENRKTFEAREAIDRSFAADDTLHIREFDPCKQCQAVGYYVHRGRRQDRIACPGCNGSKGTYTGREMTAAVTYVMEGGKFGVERGHVVMGINITHWTGSHPRALTEVTG